MSDTELAPKIIYLVDDDVNVCSRSWCDDPSPSHGLDADNAIKYDRSDIVDQLRAELEQVRKENGRLANTIDQASAYMAFHSRDWSIDHRDAAIYSLICGWDTESINELRILHGWSVNSVPINLNRETVLNAVDKGES